MTIIALVVAGSMTTPAGAADPPGMTIDRLIAELEGEMEALVFESFKGRIIARARIEQHLLLRGELGTTPLELQD